MFVRRKVAKGHTYHQLVEGYRDEGGKVRQRVVASLGWARADAEIPTVAEALAGILRNLRNRRSPSARRRGATGYERWAEIDRRGQPPGWEKSVAKWERQAAELRREADELAQRIERFETLQRRHAAVVPTTAGEALAAARAEVMRQEQLAAQYERNAERARRDHVPAWWESFAEEMEQKAAALRSGVPAAQKRVELLEDIQRRLDAAAVVVPTTPPS